MFKRKRLGLFCSGILAGAIALTAPAARAAATATVPGNVSGWVATATRTGTVPDSQQMTIAVYMTLRDVDGLKQLLAAVSNPASPSYGQYLTPATFRAHFAPDPADVAAVAAMLTQAGMTGLQVGAGGTYVSATATAAQIRSMFAISQEFYTYGGRTLRANREAPTIPASLAGKIVYIEGLDDTTLLRKPFHVSVTEGARVAPATMTSVAPAATGATPPPVASGIPSPYCDTYSGDLQATLSTAAGPYGRRLPWLTCGYTPQQVQAAYGFNRVKLDGTGIRVAIIDAYASPTLATDGNRFATNHHLPPLTAANFQQQIPPGIYNVSPNEACDPYDWWGEQSLDLAAVHGSAPGASILYIGARDCNTSLTTALLDTIYEDKADIITNSYGNNGDGNISSAEIAMQDQAFMAAGAEGITVLFSSGDDGDLSQINGVATASYEADSPYVTGVGGTSLGVKDASGKKYEYGWGNYRDLLLGARVNSGTSVTTAGLTSTSVSGSTFYDFSFYAGSGGGISLIEPQPAYQAGIVPASLASTLYDAAGDAISLPSRQRVSPDVSMVADPYTGYLYGETFTIAGNGTSDAGCTTLSSTTEYCEGSIGGTSLASPLLAGVMAVVDQKRKAVGRPLVGFANPWLYGAKIGTAATFDSAGINDITPPTKPVSLLRGYANDPTEIRVVTVNSVPYLINTTPVPLLACPLAVCEGIDDVFNYVTPAYDNVTGLGVPWVPSLVKQ